MAGLGCVARNHMHWIAYPALYGHVHVCGVCGQGTALGLVAGVQQWKRGPVMPYANTDAFLDALQLPQYKTVFRAQV